MRFLAGKWLRRAIGILTAIFLLLPLALLPGAGTALSDYISPNSSIREELAGTVVNCMMQDSSGFLWFGAQIGLYKYDGYHLKRYSFSSDAANEFFSNFITCIAEDNDRQLWIGTFGGGLFKFNPQTGEYVNFVNDPQNSDSLSDNTIRVMCRDDSGKLWIGAQSKGIDCLDPVSGHFTHYEHKAAEAGGISSNTIVSICKDRAGRLWIGTAGGGVSKFDPQSGTFRQYNSVYPGDQNISALYLDRADVLWIVTGDGRLSRLDTTAEKPINGNFSELRGLKVSAVGEDISGGLWIGTYGDGVRLLDRNSGKFIRPGYDFSADPSTYDYRVLSLYADTSGNLWISTEGSGLNIINTSLNFTSYPSGINPDMSRDVVLSIYKDRSGVIWIGTAHEGVTRFDRSNNQITQYKHNSRDKNSLSGNAVNSIYEDSRGILWLGIIDGTLNRFDPAAEKFVHYQIENNGNGDSGDNGILRIYEDQDGMLWLCAANGGLVRFDRSTGQYQRFVNDPEDPHSLSSDHMLSIAADDSGTLWLGTAGGGLNKLVPAANRFTRYGLDESGSAAPNLNYFVNSIVNDGDILWLATDKGLFKFDKKSGKSVFVGDSRQTANTFIAGLLKDDQGNLWLSTANGLIKYNIQADAFKKYEFQGGLQKNQYTPGAYFKSADGEMFCGGSNGVTCFYPDQIKDNPHRPPMVITDFKIFNTSVGLTGADPISLTYKDDFISFEFAALDYADPAKNQYAYKLEGFDTDWHYTGVRNYGSYTNLDGGEYILRIKGANNDGLWNEEGVRIKLVVTPPWWESTWFSLGVFIFCSAAIILLIKMRDRSINLRNLALELQVVLRTKELNQADEMKSEFLSMVSHEIRTPLSAILGFAELIAVKIEKNIFPHINLEDQKTKKAAETISRDLNIIISEGDRLTALVNNLLNISKIESGKMEQKNELSDISAIIEQSLLTVGPAAAKAGLPIMLDIASDLPKISVDRDMLTQVFINLIANAVKFTREGHIKIRAQNSEGAILVAVEDTGVGIEEDHLPRIFDMFYKLDPSFARSYGNNHLGLGLYICRQIIEQHGGTIWAESQPGKGSAFYFTIPHWEG